MDDIQVLVNRLRTELIVSLPRVRAAMSGHLSTWRALLVSLRTLEGRRNAWRASRPLAIFAAAYIAAWSYLFVAAFLGAHPPPAPLFPPAAVLLSALLLTPPRRWWIYLVAAFVIQVPILAYLHLPIQWNLLGFIPDAIEPVIAASLMLLFIPLPPRFASLREAGIYTACVAAGVAVAATVGSTVNASLGGEPYGSAWLTWFLSDTLANLVLAPTLLLWIAAGFQGLRADSRSRYAEAGALYGGLLLLGVVVFNTHAFGPEIADALFYLPVPLLVWAAVRFGPRGIASALSLIAVLAVPAIANATGPFASEAVPGQSVFAHVFELQLFLLVIGVPLFFLAAAAVEREQAGVALQASEARFRAAFESTAIGMMLFDLAGHIFQVNQPVVEMLGYSEAELRAHTIGELTYSEDLPHNLALLQRALAGEIDSYQLEKRIIRKDGDVMWGRVSTGVVRYATGHPAYLVGHLEDITTRKRLEREREQARVEAERRAEELDRVFEQTGEGLAIYDVEGRLVRSNAALRGMLGLDAAPASYDQMPWTERSLPLQVRDLDGRLLTADDMRHIYSGGPQSATFQLRTLDGREREVHISAAPLHDRDGRFVGKVGVLHDQTEVKRLEREREQARVEAERRAEELDRVFGAVADGIAVYDLDGREVRSNAALHRLLRLDMAPPDFAQLSLRERMALFAARDEHGRPLTPDEGPLPRALRGELVAGAEAMDLRSRVLDGSEIELNVSAAPLHDSAGQLVGVVCVYRDQTERKRLEREVADQAEQLDRIVEGMGEGLFVYDTQGQVVRTNAAARHLLGLDAAPADFSQLPAEERLALYAPNERQDGQMLTPEEWLAMRALVGSGDVLSTTEARDVRMHTLDGRELEVSASVAPLHDSDGQVMGAVLLLSDRTERNQLGREREEARASELALREVNQRLDTFVSMAAHDLRQPVTVSKIRIALAQRQVLQAAASVHGATARQTVPFTQVAQALDAAQYNLDRLWQLMQQLLDVTRAKQGILALNRQPSNLEDLVRASVEEQRLLSPSRTLTLELPEPGGLPVRVDADVERLTQVLSNYLGNAARYSSDDQPIEVMVQVIEQAAEDGGGTVARVVVRDHGPGIAPEEQATIWDRFQRAHSASEMKGGLGLGLYIARTIVERHDGHVGVESTEGEGATFWFTLPLVPTEAGDTGLAGVLSVEPPPHDDALP